MEEIHLFVTPMTPFPLIAFINEGATGYINEDGTGAIIAPRNPHFRFFILCFTVSVPPLINKHELSNGFTILTMSSISSF